jgi:hypothetical protein
MDINAPSPLAMTLVEAFKDQARLHKLARLLMTETDENMSNGFINAQIDSKSIDDWRAYLDTIT